MMGPPQSAPAVGISVIVPVYNSPEDLRLSLGALRAAATPDCEILVVDDGSSDATPSVAAGMDVPVVRLARNSGPAEARNEGAARARGAIRSIGDSAAVHSTV